MQYPICRIIPNCQFSFSYLDFWSGNFFLIAPFPDLCLSVPSYYKFVEQTEAVQN